MQKVADNLGSVVLVWQFQGQFQRLEKCLGRTISATRACTQSCLQILVVFSFSLSFSIFGHKIRVKMKPNNPQIQPASIINHQISNMIAHATLSIVVALASLTYFHTFFLGTVWILINTTTTITIIVFKQQINNTSSVVISNMFHEPRSAQDFYGVSSDSEEIVV